MGGFNRDGSKSGCIFVDFFVGVLFLLGDVFAVCFVSLALVKGYKILIFN